MAHPAESTHWYTPSGEPAYTVLAKSGEPRPTTLRDARKLRLFPSVTSIIRVAAAPGLEIWKQRQVVMAALTHPGLKGTDEDVDLILRDAKEQGIAAAARGTEIHAAIQGAYEGEETPEGMEPFVAGAKASVRQWADVDWVAEKSFAHTLGYGGKVDLSSNELVVDFKTTDKGLAGLKVWDEQIMQLAAYREGLGMPDARCAICYVSSTSGSARLIEVDQDDLQRGWECFTALLMFWKAKSRYFPKVFAAPQQEV